MVHNLTTCLFTNIIRERLCLPQKYKQFHRKKSYKALFFGSDGIALKSLRKINEVGKKEHLISQLDLVTTNSSKNKTSIEKYAEAEAINTITWPLHSLEPANYDIGLIVAFGHLIKKELLNKFPLGMVNVHPSLLPRWRGAAPIIHTLLHGDDVTGVTLMTIKPDIFDVGEIISQRKVAVPADIKLPELTDQLSDIGADMLVECLRGLPHSLQSAVPQSDHGVTYAKKIDKSISEVRWSVMTSTEIYNLYRAIYGLYPLTTKFRDKRMKLFHAFLVKNEDLVQRSPGSLEYCENNKAIKVVCKDRKCIYFRSLRIVGRREISALDFFNGYMKNMPLDKRQCMVC